MDSLILEDTKCVSCCSENIVQNEKGDEVDNCLFEIHYILESMPDLSACQYRYMVTKVR